MAGMSWGVISGAAQDVLPQVVKVCPRDEESLEHMTPFMEAAKAAVAAGWPKL